MFRRRPTAIDNILRGVLRNQGLETPLLQRRVVNAWDGVVRSMSDADMNKKTSATRRCGSRYCRLPYVPTCK